jgi:N4-(beta-N-acetylglucosaminyl)-L-asparaginase
MSKENSRRKFLKQVSILTAGAALFKHNTQAHPKPLVKLPQAIVISTWDAGIAANKPAIKIIAEGGTALDAVEKGVRVTEAEINCCVGLNGRPDATGKVTLDASIMNGDGACGAVGMLQFIKHPISVARKVMEKSKHVFLVGDGAYQFALKNGFKNEWKGLEKSSDKEYKKWLKKNKPNANLKLGGNYNHDTIGMIAMDKFGQVAGSCTTSGMAFKLHGRLGDSPIIGAGLFADNDAGAATSSGVGEEVIRVAGCAIIVELMRQGKSPLEACKEVIERIASKRTNASEMQVGFIALNTAGDFGAYALQKGFEYTVNKLGQPHQLVKADYHFKN